MKHFLTTLLMFVALYSPYAVFATEKREGDDLVILHGIAHSSSHMDNLAAYLQQQGYNVINPDYPSTDHALEKLVDLIHKRASKKLIQNKPVHCVGYSMRSLLICAIIHKHRPKNLGRIVQLAPPNNGSEIADFLKDSWLYKEFYGPVGQQFITDQQKIKSLFDKIDYEFGVFAGNSTLDPISLAIITGDDDEKVSIKSTKLKGIKDHVIVLASHTFFPSTKKVHRQIQKRIR